MEGLGYDAARNHMTVTYSYMEYMILNYPNPSEGLPVKDMV